MTPAEIQCSGKVRFNAPNLAEKAARRVSRSHEIKMNAYRCPQCRGWHVGSREKWQGASG